jgi:hypothetical protein
MAHACQANVVAPRPRSDRRRLDRCRTSTAPQAPGRSQCADDCFWDAVRRCRWGRAWPEIRPSWCPRAGGCHVCAAAISAGALRRPRRAGTAHRPPVVVAPNINPVLAAIGDNVTAGTFVRRGHGLRQPHDPPKSYPLLLPTPIRTSIDIAQQRRGPWLGSDARPHAGILARSPVTALKP